MFSAIVPLRGMCYICFLCFHFDKEKWGACVIYKDVGLHLGCLVGILSHHISASNSNHCEQLKIIRNNPSHCDLEKVVNINEVNLTSVLHDTSRALCKSVKVSIDM